MWIVFTKLIPLEFYGLKNNKNYKNLVKFNNNHLKLVKYLIKLIIKSNSLITH